MGYVETGKYGGNVAEKWQWPVGYLDTSRASGYPAATNPVVTKLG